MEAIDLPMAEVVPGLVGCYFASDSLALALTARTQRLSHAKLRCYEQELLR